MRVRVGRFRFYSDSILNGPHLFDILRIGCIYKGAYRYTYERGVKLLHSQLIGAFTVIDLIEVVILVYDHGRHIAAVGFRNGQGGALADIDNSSTIKSISIASDNALPV